MDFKDKINEIFDNLVDKWSLQPDEESYLSLDAFHLTELVPSQPIIEGSKWEYKLGNDIITISLERESLLLNEWFIGLFIALNGKEVYSLFGWDLESGARYDSPNYDSPNYDEYADEFINLIKQHGEVIKN